MHTCTSEYVGQKCGKLRISYIHIHLYMLLLPKLTQSDDCRTWSVVHKKLYTDFQLNVSNYVGDKCWNCISSIKSSKMGITPIKIYDSRNLSEVYHNKILCKFSTQYVKRYKTHCLIDCTEDFDLYIIVRLFPKIIESESWHGNLNLAFISPCNFIISF